MVASSHALINVELSSFDTRGGYNVVLLGLIKLRLVFFASEIEVHLVVIKIFLDGTVFIYIPFHGELAVLVKRPIISNLRVSAEVNTDAATIRQMK